MRNPGRASLGHPAGKGKHAAGTLERIRRLPGVRQATIFGQAIFLLVDERVSPTDLGLKNEEVHPAEPTLEDVFVTLSRAQADAK